MARTRQASKIGLFFLLGLVIGWIASLFTPNKTRQKQKQEIESRVEFLQKLLKDKKERTRVKDLFQKRSEEAIDTYRSARQTFIFNLAHTKGSLKSIDKKKYSQAVSTALKEIKKTTKSLPNTWANSEIFSNPITPPSKKA